MAMNMSFEKIGRSALGGDKLTLSELREHLEYDPATGTFKRLISTNMHRPGTLAGTKHRSGYIMIRLFRSRYPAHRLAWFYIHGIWPKKQIDHIDGVKSNNAFANLREATNTQNQHNVPRKGFFFNRRNGKFCALIRINGQSKYLGTFDTAESAREAYLAAHAKHAGEFSFTCRPDGGQTTNNASRPSAASSPGAQ